MDQTAARRAIGARGGGWCGGAGGQACPLEQRPATRIRLAGDRNGPVNPAPTQDSTMHGATPSPGAPGHQHNVAPVQGLRASPLVRDAAPRSSSAFAQTSPIAASNRTPQEAQTARPRRAWPIGLIWFIWFNHLHTTPPTARSTDADGLFQGPAEGNGCPRVSRQCDG